MWNCDSACLFGMLVLAMTTTSICQIPTIIFQPRYNFSAVHTSIIKLYTLYTLSRYAYPEGKTSQALEGNIPIQPWETTDPKPADVAVTLPSAQYPDTAPARPASHDPEEQEKRLKYLDLVASAVILQNTVDISYAIRALSEEGSPLKRELLASLSPYLTRHLKRYEDYVFDLGNIPQPLEGAMILQIDIAENQIELALQRFVALNYTYPDYTPVLMSHGLELSLRARKVLGRYSNKLRTVKCLAIEDFWLICNQSEPKITLFVNRYTYPPHLPIE